MPGTKYENRNATEHTEYRLEINVCINNILINYIRPLIHSMVSLKKPNKLTGRYGIVNN